MDVSENNGIPKSSILIGFSIINYPFWVPLFLETPTSFSKKKALMAYDGQHGIGFWEPLRGDGKTLISWQTLMTKEQRPYQPALRHLALPIESLNLEGKMQQPQLFLASNVIGKVKGTPPNAIHPQEIRPCEEFF